MDYEVFRQKYLHTVHFPSLSVVLNSPDDSFFLKKKTLSAQSDLIYSQKRTSALYEANMFQCWESSLSTWTSSVHSSQILEWTSSVHSL